MKIVKLLVSLFLVFQLFHYGQTNIQDRVLAQDIQNENNYDVGLDYKFYVENNIIFVEDIITHDVNIAGFVSDEKPILSLLPVHSSGDISPTATSEWIKTGSNLARTITLSKATIKLGANAIVNALISAFVSFSQSANLAIAAGSATMTAIANQIFDDTSNGTYSATLDIVHARYYYGGCTWLRGNEFIYPDGRSTFGYAWSDNPQLGVAPTPCKVAALSYPYRP